MYIFLSDTLLTVAAQKRQRDQHVDCYRIDDVQKGIIVIKVHFCKPLQNLPETLDQILASVCPPPRCKMRVALLDLLTRNTERGKIATARYIILLVTRTSAGVIAVYAHLYCLTCLIACQVLDGGFHSRCHRNAAQKCQILSKLLLKQNYHHLIIKLT